MSLASAMSTALTGLNASETQIDVIGNNLANANTVGFKASDVVFANQFLQTQSVGSGPTDASGGSNPQQEGLGVEVAQITPNFSQGTISAANSSTDMAIQGDGFFIVQGENGQQSYTRNGTFTTNAQDQLVTATGNRVMGFGVNSNFEIDASQLQPITIPLGNAMVAKATTEATLQGALTPSGKIANTAAILQTGALTDGSYSYPGSNTTPAAGMTATAVTDANGNLPAGNYQYYVTFVNGSVQSKPQPVATSVTLNSTGEVTLTNLPTDSSGDWTGMTIYRGVNTASGTTFYALPAGSSGSTVVPLGTTSITDNNTDATLIANDNVLNTGGAHVSGPTATIAMDASTDTPVVGNLTGNYEYYVTFSNPSNNTESRPQLLATDSPALSDNEVALSNLPIDISGQWTQVNIYRNTTDTPGDTNFYEIDSIPMSTLTADPGYQYTDNATDQSIASNKVLSFDGPPVTNATLLTNVVEYDPSSGTYSTPFPTTGSLSFTGAVGGSTLTTQDFTVAKTSTLGDLTSFMQGALGIQSPPGNDPNNPIPVDSVTGQSAGVTITSKGQIQIVSNDGADEAASVGLSALQFTSDGTTNSVNLPFNQTQAAVGQGTTTSMTAYDSLGMPLTVNITAVLESRTSSATVYRWYADCGQNDPGSGAQQGIAVGTGTVTFDGEGNFVSASNTTVSIGRANEPSVKPLEFNLDFSQVSGLAATTASLSVASQDGSAPGVLNSFSISDNGMISGVFSNGISQDLGQIRLARFSNPAGLEQVGQNMYTTGVNSGLPIMGNPGDSGTGTIVAGSLEASNTDIGGSLIDLITTSTMYQANTRVITTATQLFDVLLQLAQTP
jgi:flagellar hook protein FlgE